MSTPIEKNAWKILTTLTELPTNEMGQALIDAKDLQKITGLSPAEINDAIALLEPTGNIELLNALGTAPFTFRGVEITPLGRNTVQQQIAENERSQYELSHQNETPEKGKSPPVPLGSPYGFTDNDWEIVSERKSKGNTLNVVMGYQFKSEHYDGNLLKENVEKMFQKAVDKYNGKSGSIRVTLEFTPLAAGYGEHLFNEIARDVISADIAIFDASDLNPNVMIEMGVALTWGVRVLPIKEKTRPKPPSDISGQTWADYENSGANFTDSEHENKLVRMVERAARKKNS